MESNHALNNGRQKENTMTKAIRWKMTEKQQVVLETFEFATEALQPSEIAVRTEFTAISPGTECANYQALDPDVYSPTGWCRYPWTPGYTGVGRVTAVGAEVREFAVGDRVHGFMPHASHCVMNVHDAVVKVPDGVKPEQAPYAKLAGISATALQVIRFEPMMTVGIWGQGMIGNFAAQLFQQAGATVIGVDPLAQRRDLARQCGIRNLLDPNAVDFGETLNAVSPDGLDVIVDTTGHAPTAIAIAQHARMRGQYVFLTHWRSQAVTDATPLVNAILWKCLTVHGAHEAFVEAELGGRDRWVTVQKRKWSRILDAMARGDIRVAPLISHLVKPAQAKEAYDGLCFQKNQWWGVVVDWR